MASEWSGAAAVKENVAAKSVKLFSSTNALIMLALFKRRATEWLLTRKRRVLSPVTVITEFTLEGS